MASRTSHPATQRSVLMGALQRLREMLWPRSDQPSPAYALAPAPNRRPRALPRPATGPLAEPEWRPMWPGNRPRRQPAPADDAGDA